MHVGAIHLNSWKCFAGEQAIELGPRAYSVSARHADNPGRSNWGGKSALLESIGFALHGEHVERLEDGWITRGERAGGVALEVVDGSQRFKVLRSRERGKSTVLHVTANGSALRGDAAQSFIDSRLGINKDDFAATCYFQQRQMARMVLARPQERMDILTAWLRLDPLVRAEELARAAVAAALDRVLVDREEHRVATAVLDDELGIPVRDGGRTTLRELEGRLTAAEVKLSGYEHAYVEAAAVASEARKTERLRARVEEYDRIAAEGKELARQLESMDLDALDRAREQAAALERDLAVAQAGLARDEAAKRKVRLGQFDGQCPVAGIECPAVDAINRKGKASKQAHDAAQAALTDSILAYDEVARELQTAEAKQQAAQRLKARLEAMRDQIRDFHREYKVAKAAVAGADPEAAQREVERTGDLVVEGRAALDVLRRSVERASGAAACIEASAARLDKGELEVALRREVLLVFGKNGAQRRVAERALGQIEEGANAMLEECGIDLSVQVQWSRQGEGLARACDACGQPFPASAKVKSCTRCRAERGPLVVNKLELVLSDRSGAAEDLVGASFQLAASAWLRGERGAAWGMALIDEPYGALDESNRHAFSTHLATMLSGRYGFEQALVVSHSRDAQSMMPGQIEITCEGGRSRLRVA